MAALRTPLHGLASKAGASFQEWGAWELPRAYSEVATEHRAALEGAVVHDSSYAGRVRATGEDVLDLLHRLSTNDVLSIEAGRGAPTVLTTDRGRILDLVSVLNLGDHVLLITGTGAPERVMEFIDKYTIVDDVTLEDVTSSTAMLSVIGPQAPSLLCSLDATDLMGFSSHDSVPVSIAGSAGHIIKRDLGTVPRFEVVVPHDHAEAVWKELVAVDAVPMGLEAYEALRIDMGSPEYERELGESYNPLEAGLWGSISFTKGCYIGQEVIARLDTYQKVQRHLVSLSFSPDARAEAGMKLTVDGKEVGEVTSVAMLPTTGGLIGLGYVRKDASEAGVSLGILDHDGTRAKVEAVVLPFDPGEGV